MINEYVESEWSRQRHAIECQDHLGLRPFGCRAAAELTDALLPQAIENDRLATLAELAMITCRDRRIVVPSPAALERLCAELRHQARRKLHRRLTDGLSAEQRKSLDALAQRREDTGQNWLTWLRQMPQAAKPAAMLGLIARLEHVRAGIEPGRGHLVHQARLAQLAREAARVTVQHVAGYERQRRHATLVAIGLDLGATLTDQAIDLFDRLVGGIFRKAEGRQFFRAAGFGRDASFLNSHYSHRSGFKVYTHLSDRYGPFFTKLIAATASEALHVLDALLYHQSEVPIGRHHTDGVGDSDHVFALCALLAFQFAPASPTSSIVGSTASASHPTIRRSSR